VKGRLASLFTIVRPVPVHPDTDSKNAERKSILANVEVSYGISQKGIHPTNEISSHPNAAVTIALLKSAGSDFLKK
jgi:hypothetical protein